MFFKKTDAFSTTTAWSGVSFLEWTLQVPDLFGDV